MPTKKAGKKIKVAPVTEVHKTGVNSRAAADLRRSFHRAPVIGNTNAEALFKAFQPYPGVLPKGEKILAMDDSYSSMVSWASANIPSGMYGGEGFISYPELSILAQRAEFRKISETIAFEMTREWIEIYSKNADDGDDKSDKIEAIEDRFEKIGVRASFQRIAAQDGFFGRSHLYLDTGKTDQPDELITDLGDGSDTTSKAKVSKDFPLLAVRPVEAVWCYPMDYNSFDPLAPGWYRPKVWYVNAKPVHASRLLTFIGREVPDLLKPAYSFGGLSMTQMAKPYVDNWIRTRKSVGDIVNAFSIFVLKTDLSQILQQGGGEDLWNRLDVFNTTRDNAGVLAVDMNTEDFSNVSASLSGLHELQAQSQEHMASVSGIPLVKLLGIQPSGLNASSEGELDCFETLINGYQESFFRPNLERVFNFVQLSLFGEIDPDLRFKFKPLGVLDEQQVVEIQKGKIANAVSLIDSGVISPEEARANLVKDPESGFEDLDPEDLPDMGEEEQEGLSVKPGAGGQGGGGPVAPPVEKPAGGRGGNDAAPKLTGRAREDFELYLQLASDETVRMASDDFEPKHVPAGHPNGGQFVSQGGGSGSKASSEKSKAISEAPGSFNSAMKKMSALPKKEKQAAQVKMHDLLGKPGTSYGPTTFSDAMKLLSSKTPMEKKKFAQKFHDFLDGKEDPDDELTNLDLNFEPEPPGATPPSMPTAHHPAVSTLNSANKNGFGIGDVGMSANNPEILNLVKGYSKLQFNAQSGDWSLESPGHMTKVGNGGDALDALLNKPMVDWQKAGVKNGSVLDDDPKGENTTKSTPSPKLAEHTETLKKIAAVRPKATSAQESAIGSYKGSGYGSMNHLLRHENQHNKKTEHMKEWLNKAALPEDVTLYRGVSGDYSKILKSILDEGVIFKDRGFMSTSTSDGFASSWKGGSNNLLMTIKAKKGQKGAAIRPASHDDHEYEVVFQCGSKLKVISFDWDNNHVECELVQD